MFLVFNKLYFLSCVLRDQEVGSSNLLSPTKYIKIFKRFQRLFLERVFEFLNFHRFLTGAQGYPYYLLSDNRPNLIDLQLGLPTYFTPFFIYLHTVLYRISPIDPGLMELHSACWDRLDEMIFASREYDVDCKTRFFWPTQLTSHKISA